MGLDFLRPDPLPSSKEISPSYEIITNLIFFEEVLFFLLSTEIFAEPRELFLSSRPDSGDARPPLNHSRIKNLLSFGFHPNSFPTASRAT